MKSQSPCSAKMMDLLVSYHQAPSVNLRNQLVKLNTGLVRKIVHRLCHQCGEPFEDLEQIGYLGLIRAIERFNPKQGCAFSSFAVPYIRGEILHYLRDRSSAVKIPRRWQELQKTAQRVCSELSHELGRNPKDAEVATRLGISKTEWQEMQVANHNRSPLSLDACITHQHESSPLSLGDMLPDTHAQVLLHWEEDRAQLQHALSQLEEKTRSIIEMVYLQELPRKVAAERLGVSPMTVSRRLKSGIEQLAVFLGQPIQACKP
ncbi:RNA polymerase sigma factor SigF [Pseudanabaena sp. FACHB-2040]|uniref:RNA polymerase sigma factor SigF n=1 Tax=Pseudanabaena sp. FACHB-2040 TaxID=2692859 RepID=UPI0016854B1D|nr:RNA polymerase sigma factor SigF [Pseudanabaena sp. FACHB-2040]MBD0268825.1 RNA polymerase sigma factor SigF [Cyanobacteria bacterium Co-bin8]MBD2256514.1 RNA polymerase sigma factor SigF [Pseudanabaena sp. FACHB-2040]